MSKKGNSPFLNPSRFIAFQEEKKLVRYRNNQVVSTKGERFSYAKQEESEEMKKTYVNLKPARKYRFHWNGARENENTAW